MRFQLQHTKHSQWQLGAIYGGQGHSRIDDCPSSGTAPVVVLHHNLQTTPVRYNTMSHS